MTDKKIKQIPYGLANYELLVRQDCYYVDKTMYLRDLEKVGNYLFFIRPRRFGKSLFISMMHAYYDVFYKDRFEEFFKGTWIYDHPTEERGTYLVLSFNFSVVEPGSGKMENSFISHVQDRAVNFLQKYSDRLSAYPEHNYFKQKIKESKSGADILSSLLQLCKGAQQKVVVIIDEYDNFANTIISTSGEGAYRALTHGTGFFRTFFNSLKEGTTDIGAPITRNFITGVSPITMDDVTSGYNIGNNITTEPAFHRMLGFTREDIMQMIEYYRVNGLIKDPTDYLLNLITDWYGNYRFYPKDEEKMFNPDMVLYFLDKYMARQEIPGDLIDRNVRMDYEKLRHLIIVDKGQGKVSNGNFERLKEIIAEGKISSPLVSGFPLENLTSRENFISLLFYFGLLTIEKEEATELELVIPNEAIRRFYYEYIKKVYDETGVFSLDLYRYSRLMKGMAIEGEWMPLLDYIAGLMRESMSLRDLITGEKSIQAFLNVYLGLSDLYILHVERELNKGYADIVMEPFLARYQSIKYAYLIEIKYVRAGVGTGDKGLKPVISAAEEQLKNYSMDQKFRQNIEKVKLIKVVLIFSGHEVIYRGESTK